MNCIHALKCSFDVIAITETWMDQTSSVARALNVTKGHTFSLLDKSMKCGTDDLYAMLFQNFDGSNLRF